MTLESFRLYIVLYKKGRNLEENNYFDSFHFNRDIINCHNEIKSMFLMDQVNVFEGLV